MRHSSHHISAFLGVEELVKNHSNILPTIQVTAGLKTLNSTMRGEEGYYD